MLESNPGANYMFQIKNQNTRARCERHQNNNNKTPERHQ